MRLPDEPSSNPDTQNLLQTILSFINTENPEEAKNIVEAHPELLGDKADYLMELLLNELVALGSESDYKLIESYRSLLGRCRRVGIAQAFAELDAQTNATSILLKLQDIEKSVENYQLTGNLTMLDSAIDAWEQILNHPGFPLAEPSIISSAENNAGNLYLKRYRACKRLSDFNRALELYQQALSSISEVDPDYAMYLDNLSDGLMERFELTGNLNDLEEAIEIYRKLVDAIPEEQSDLAKTLMDLSIGLRKRYERTYRLDDLEEAIDVCKHAVMATPEGNPDLATYLGRLGYLLWYRFKHTGRLDDNEEFIKAYRQAIVATPAGHLDLAMYLSSLANGLSIRFELTGRLDDIEEAIDVCKQAVETTPKEHQNFGFYLGNLSKCLSDRFERTNRLDHLEESIIICKQAVMAIPEGYQKAVYLNLLGTEFLAKYIHMGSIDDLEEGIKVFKKAVAATPKEHPDYASHLSNLSNGLLKRFERIGSLVDLEKAIDNYKQLVTAVPEDPELAWYFSNLAICLNRKFAVTDNPTDLEDAIHSYRQACKLGIHINPKNTLLAARNWQRWAFYRGSWTEVVEAYNFIEQAMEQRISHQFSRMDKTFSLEGVQGLAAQASYAHIQLDQLGEAVESLEAGRAQILREALERQRRDLHRLQELGFKDLYERFVEASDRYDRLMKEVSSKTHPPDWVDQIDDASRDMQSAAESIREQAGAKNSQYRFFLKPLSLEAIQEQAHETPLIYLAATSFGGMALIVNGTRLKVIELSELTDKALLRTLQGSDEDPESGGYLGAYMKWRKNCSDLNAFATWKSTLDKTTRWLWDTIMGRVLTCLGDDSINEVVIIPTGLLSLLPLHAAWMEDPSCPTGRRYALDNFTITYVPSAQALYHVRQGTSRRADTLLAVENPDGTLRFAELEVNSVLDHFHGKSIHLLGDKAKKADVIEAIGSSHVLHFTTHGQAGWQEAESSRLKLADRDLILTELFDLHLDQARLAVLSACETGVPGTELPDETVSLPSAWMQAGLPGVVGSLWPVDDMGTAMLMAQFYDQWRDKHLSPPEALRRAQIWLRDSTVEELKLHFKASIESEVMPMKVEAAKSFYKKIGWKDPKVLLFDHPFYWAAFGYTGL
jgi:CHAT domain-containing protein/tetratricopeptide (TPR) repeat protein